MPLPRNVPLEGHYQGAPVKGWGLLWVIGEEMREKSDPGWTSLVSPISDETKDGLSAESEEEDQPAGSGLTEDLLGLPELASKTYSK